MHGRSIFESEFSNNVSSPRDKTKRKQKFTLKISERIAKFVARNTTMRIGIASRRVGSHYLASFRKKKRKGGGGGVPRAAIDLPPRNFIVHRWSTDCVRACILAGWIDTRRMRKRIATGSYPSPSPLPVPLSRPVPRSWRRSARWGRIIHRLEHVADQHGFLTAVMWPGGSVRQALHPSCIHPTYRRVDEMVNRRAVEARGRRGWRRTELKTMEFYSETSEWKKVGARESCLNRNPTTIACCCSKMRIIVSYITGDTTGIVYFLWFRLGGEGKGDGAEVDCGCHGLRLEKGCWWSAVCIEITELIIVVGW